MDTLKPLSEITVRDTRHDAFVVLEAGGPRRVTLEHHYQGVDQITLHDDVPEEIREHFEVAKNLLLYSWYVYRFIPVAEFHASATLEFALRLRSNKPNWGLKRLIKFAISEGWVKNEDFFIFRQHQQARNAHRSLIRQLDPSYELPDEKNDYVEKLVEAIPYLRNQFAHGANMVHPDGHTHLEICADFINQLFDSEI